MKFDDDALDGASEEHLDEPRLPRHLAALVGALHGPSDLGVHHDKYLTYPHREESGGVATA
ncbi:hypothetical protein SAMN05216275_13228 [Streptosporangium canum]|uniref:Uncharacterized protein n=1 Tax=Streptosporangium canum TaxID=324952 RepID=A0A1I4BIR1_9ACTN|nr:hypothetical protein [Streptosporangium canum]SFK68638.1 hypothetical protein SAMN05216275_13228 [Streptosporangium canum]